MRKQQGDKSIFDAKFFYLKIPVEILKLEIVNENVKRLKPNIKRDDIPNYDCPEGPDFNLFIERLTSDEHLILSRILYWTRGGMPCTHTNAQFAELIGKSVGMARRCVKKQIRHKLVDAYYPNAQSRELTALVGVEAEQVIKRKAAQLARRMRTSAQGGGHQRAAKPRLDAHGRAPITKSKTKKN